jgi:hypothetical protein
VPREASASDAICCYEQGCHSWLCTLHHDVLRCAVLCCNTSVPKQTELKKLCNEAAAASWCFVHVCACSASYGQQDGNHKHACVFVCVVYGFEGATVLGIV